MHQHQRVLKSGLQKEEMHKIQVSEPIQKHTIKKIQIIHQRRKLKERKRNLNIIICTKNL